jgi:hypothetical protein
VAGQKEAIKNGLANLIGNRFVDARPSKPGDVKRIIEIGAWHATPDL